MAPIRPTVLVADGGDVGEAMPSEAAAGALNKYGTQYMIEYFKKNEQYTIINPYTKTRTTIYQYLTDAANVNEDANNVGAALKNTFWYTDVNERVKAPIFAVAAENGIQLSNTQLDEYRDMNLAGLKSLAELKYDFGQMAIKNLNLDIDRPDIANAIRGGKSFSEAVGDYASIYAKTLGIPSSAFNPADQTFVSLLKTSPDLTAFESAVKMDPRYLQRTDVKQLISANQLSVKQKYMSYGMNIDDFQANDIATRIVTGQTNDVVIDNELRKQAAIVYRPFADQIMAGVPMSSLVSPYEDAWFRRFGTRAGLGNQNIQKAMQGRTVVKGDSTETYATSIYDFDQEIMKLPEYQYTDDARKRTEALTVDILSRFGFIG